MCAAVRSRNDRTWGKAVASLRTNLRFVEADEAEAKARTRTPRAVTYPYRRIAAVEGTPADGPDPYGDPDPAWLKIDWQQHLRTIDVDGAQINYAEIGDGPAVIFVHGLGCCWQNWLEKMPLMAEL